MSSLRESQSDYRLCGIPVVHTSLPVRRKTYKIGGDYTAKVVHEALDEPERMYKN